MENCLAIIPARGGSKRIPKKNIKSFLSKPIISYSIESAIESKLFDEVMVSTDDVEVAEIALKYGAKVPFMRSNKNSDDYATTVDVLKEVISEYQIQGKTFDNICCIYATAPFANSIKLIEAFNKLIKSDVYSVFPIVDFGYPIQRALKIESEKLNMFWPENYKKRSQDLEKAYHDAGQFFWCKSTFFQNDLKHAFENAGFIIMKEHEVQDIDSLTDWQLAELKFKALNPGYNSI